MKLIYEIDVTGFENAPHPKAFYEKWLQDGPEALYKNARALIAGEVASRSYSSQPHHGKPPAPGWKYIGCLGAWKRGDVRSADCHCLEIFQDPHGDHYLVDQSEHGDFAGHSYERTVLERIPDEPLASSPTLAKKHLKNDEDDMDVMEEIASDVLNCKVEFLQISEVTFGATWEAGREYHRTFQVPDGDESVTLYWDPVFRVIY